MMKFEIWAEGDSRVGIIGSGARVDIENLEWADEDEIRAVTEILREAFKDIFDDTRVHVAQVTETGVIDR